MSIGHRRTYFSITLCALSRFGKRHYRQTVSRVRVKVGSTELLSPRGPVAASTARTRVLVSNATLQQKEARPPGEWLIPWLGQETHKMGLEHLEKQKIRECSKNQTDGVRQGDVRVR